MFIRSLGGGGGGGGVNSRIQNFSKIQLLYFLVISFSFIDCYLHVDFFLPFICFVFHMSEFEALLASRRSF